MRRFWVFGKLSRFFAFLHYRVELAPYCRRNGYTQAEARDVALFAVGELFDRAYPEQSSKEESREL